MRTIFSPNHLLHDTAPLWSQSGPFAFDEVPARVEVIRLAVDAAGLGSLLPPQDHGLEPILAIHTSEFVAFLQSAFATFLSRTGRSDPVIPEAFSVSPVRVASRHPIALAGRYSFGVDSPILAGTWQAAYESAQCALTAADDLLAGHRAAYALCRPPGHHASADLYGGFCYLNNAAIAARYLQHQGKSDRVAILDIDYHHGNGTQELFYSDPSVLFCSLHASPEDAYPYFWGSTAETGDGLGQGYNHNWPLPQKIGDLGYLDALAEALMKIERFTPACLIVSLGLDIALGDKLGGFCITEQGFHKIGRRIASVGIPTLIVQEGGYHLETLGASAIAFLYNFS